MESEAIRAGRGGAQPTGAGAAGGIPPMESLSVRDALKRIRGVHIGVDIGQKVDYSAIVVAEVGERPGPETHIDWRTRQPTPVMEATYRVHELRRLPLGTPFVARAAE